eukprot:CFRG5772T1
MGAKRIMEWIGGYWGEGKPSTDTNTTSTTATSELEQLNTIDTEIVKPAAHKNARQQPCIQNPTASQKPMGNISQIMSVPDFSTVKNNTWNKKRDFKELLREYMVVKTLSEGSTAEVFLAEERKTGKLVIIKEQLLEKRDRRGVHREASIHSRLQHPNIVELYATAKNHKVMVLLQEYVGGGELFDAVIPDIGVHPMHIRDYLVQLVSATKYLHDSGVAHRDLKPENVVLDKEKNIVKIIDFGLSEYVSEDYYTLYKRHVGTVPYMAAELWKDRSKTHIVVDIKATDVWALGIMLFCMLVGRFPWGEASLRSKEFERYLSGDFSRKPWRTIPLVQLTLLKHMLDINPQTRWTIGQVEEYVMLRWKPVRMTIKVSEHSSVRKTGTPTAESGTIESATDSGIESMNVSSDTINLPLSPCGKDSEPSTGLFLGVDNVKSVQSLAGYEPRTDRAAKASFG